MNISSHFAAAVMEYYPPFLFRTSTASNFGGVNRNQRKIRKARRQRNAAGFKGAFA